MKTVYQAANSIEAHMILNLIEQAGFYARVDGDYLQGGVGELQAMGVVRVVVNDQDYPQTKALVSEWEAMQPESEPASPVAPRQPWSITSVVAGALIGGAAVTYFTQTPATQPGIDFNGDGFNEITASYKNGQLNKIEYRAPDTRELVKVQWYQNNQLVREQIDSDGDGVLDRFN